MLLRRRQHRDVIHVALHGGRERGGGRGHGRDRGRLRLLLLLRGAPDAQARQEDALRLRDGAAAERTGVKARGAARAARQVSAGTERRVDVAVHADATQQLVLQQLQPLLQLLQAHQENNVTRDWFHSHLLENEKEKYFCPVNRRGHIVLQDKMLLSKNTFRFLDRNYQNPTASVYEAKIVDINFCCFRNKFV